MTAIDRKTTIRNVDDDLDLFEFIKIRNLVLAKIFVLVAASTRIRYLPLLEQKQAISTLIRYFYCQSDHERHLETLGPTTKDTDMFRR